LHQRPSFADLSDAVLPVKSKAMEVSETLKKNTIEFLTWTLIHDLDLWANDKFQPQIIQEIMTKIQLKFIAA
jgi:hypothetical protein